MQLQIKQHSIVIQRGVGDPTFYGERNGAGESRLLYWLKNELNQRGWNLIKKRMWKDGHLVDNMQQYLRSRKINSETVVIWNPGWVLEGAGPRLMRIGKVAFSIER